MRKRERKNRSRGKRERECVSLCMRLGVCERERETMCVRVRVCQGDFEIAYPAFSILRFNAAKKNLAPIVPTVLIRSSNLPVKEKKILHYN